MKWLITGGTGLIGKTLAYELAGKGEQVNVLSRDSAKASLFKHPGIRFFTGDILTPETLIPAMEGCDGIFHLAAYAKGWAKDNRIFFDFNVTGTRNVLEAAMHCGIKRVVLTSTAGVLGPSDGHPKDENEGMLNKVFYTPYEESKHQAETEAHSFLKKGMEIITVYPTRVFGPGPLHDSNAVTKLIKLYAEGKWRFLPGNGKKKGNYVFVEDVATGLILAMTHGQSGEGYILGGENLTFREMFHTIGEQTGHRRIMIPLPWPVMALVVIISLAISFLSGRPPLINFKWLERYMQNWSFTSEKAVRELGYNPRPFSQGVKQTWQFIRDEMIKNRDV